MPVLDELLYEKRYSLLFEGHRWIDLRHYGMLGTLPKDLPTHKIFSTFQLPRAASRPAGWRSLPGRRIVTEPMADSPDNIAVTRLLVDARQGDARAMDRLLPILYAELHGIAEHHMRRERPDHTLEPTGLVHEAFLRLIGGTEIEWQDRAHFLRTASQVMRRVLVDHARARNAAKRGTGLRVTLDEALLGGADDRTLDLLVLDDALTRLAAAEPRWAQVVELRCFAGLDVAEVAKVLDVSAPTVIRDWRFARAFLANELRPGEPGSADG